MPEGRSFSFEYIRPPERRHTFDCRLLHADSRTLVLQHEMHPSSPLVIGNETVLAAEYRSTWFLYKGQPWDIARVSRPDGTFTGYYADVLEPVRWLGADAETLQPIVDLFLDLWISPDGSFTILDEDELEEAVKRRWLTARHAALARRTLEDLIDATRSGAFPPNEVRKYGEVAAPR